MGAALGRVLGLSEAKRTAVAQAATDVNQVPEKAMAAATCAGLSSPSPWRKLVREQS